MAKPELASLLRQALDVLDKEKASSNVGEASSSTTTSSILPTPKVFGLNSTPTRAHHAVQDELSRIFSPYSRPAAKKRPASLWSIKPSSTTSYTHKFFCMSSRKDDEVPSLSYKETLTAAGMGERKIVFPDKLCSASDFSAQLVHHYPKLRDGGGYELLHIVGSTRSKVLEVLPCPKNGYSPMYLLSAEAGLGKATIYIRPLQKDLCLEPVWGSSADENDGPMVECMYCHNSFKHSNMQDHVDICTRDFGNTETPTVQAESDNHGKMDTSTERQTTSEGRGHRHTQNETDMYRQTQIESSQHTERQTDRWPQTDSDHHRLQRQSRQREEQPSTSSYNGSVNIFQSPEKSHNAEWKAEKDPEKAAETYRRDLLQQSETYRSLKYVMDMHESPEEKERAVVVFYKQNNINWASPFCVFLKGDPAVGDGVNRFFFTFGISKLQSGFSFGLDDTNKSLLFVGEEDHLVPSTSTFLLEGDIFHVAGRIIGHSFLNGGPKLTGLSQAILDLISGKEDTNQLATQDSPDIDVREVVTLLTSKDPLSPADKHNVAEMCVAWDLPTVVNDTNRNWLAEKILHHSVITRRIRQIKQLKKGLKDTGVLQLLKEKPETAAVLFPRSSSLVVMPEMILERVIWPSNDSSDSEQECNIEQQCSALAFFRQYVENANSESLKDLLKFWVGWVIFPQHLYIKVTSGLLPKSKTCYETLQIPGDHTGYSNFKEALEGAVRTADTGFGFI
ncbi:uncharacterized protein LOC113073000 isoform X1 [Carassius auratus]|uniref:Uncharacterized protein LOC113073000 isoform X1 n=2 Tax=Carassius auratus TaxID=7957 RepID=A0A6P6MYA5_CARAU|nr:uncharacterized protein LOC113073000 isoform X1 [Carassius auratus]